MSDSYAAKEPLGVGSILSESFSIFFKCFFPIIIITFLVSVIGLMISLFVLGTETTLGLNPDPFAFYSVQSGVSIILQQVIYAFAVAIIVQLAYDFKNGTPLRYSQYMSRALTFIVPLTVLGIVITITAGIGLVLLIVPGIWIYAVWSVTTPAVVVERAGFGGLNRSFELTREYRWPIVGLLILLGLILIVVSIPFGLVSNMMIGLNVFDIESLPSADALTTIDVMLWVLINSAASAISYGLGCVAVALVYIRLRQIKDGVGVSDVADVFD